MKSYSKDKENSTFKRRGKMLFEAVVIALLCYGAYKLYEDYVSKEEANQNKEKKDDSFYRRKIEKIEQREYPKFLSYNLYLETKIRQLPEEIVSKLKQKYQLRADRPIIDFGDLKYDTVFKNLLKERIEQEPEIVNLIQNTGSILVNFDSFLNKKAELEAKRIIDELVSSNKEVSNG